MVFLVPENDTIEAYTREQAGFKIGCVVNDVAAVNIDAKLVRNQTTENDDIDAKAGNDIKRLNKDTIELQNGCVCCSVSQS